MFKIGEFSQMGQVSVRMLRHYDDMGLLKPAQIDPFTGYRYYLIDQLPRLNRILALKDLGIPLEQIAPMLDGALAAADMRAMLVQRQAEMERQLQEEFARLRRIEARLHLIEQEGALPEYDVVLKAVPAQHTATLRRTVPHISMMKEYRCDLYGHLYDLLAGARIPRAGHEFALYHHAEYVEDNIDMEIGIPIPDPAAAIPEVTLRPLEALPVAASVVHRGSMWGIANAMVALYAWVATSGYQVGGVMREFHLSFNEGEPYTLNPDDVVVEMVLPVREG